MRKLFRRSCIITAALLASAVLQVARADVEVLSKVPGDAYGVLVVNNVRNLANKISNAATRMNIPAPPDLVGYATRNLGITEGFNPDASAAIVFLKPSAERKAEGYFSGPPPAVIILPTSDAKTMLKPFDPKETDKPGISEVTLPQDPADKGYVATVEDKWVVFAQSKDDLTAYLARTASFADNANAATKKVFDDNDLVAWGNVPKLSEGLDKFIDEAQSSFGGMLDLQNMANNMDPVGAAVQKQSVGLVFSMAKQFLKDADATMLTLRMTDSGATLGMVGDFKSDTTIGKYVAALKDAKPVSLQGLPNGNGGFLGAGAAIWDPASMVKLATNYSDTIMADDTIAKDPRAPEFKKEFDIQKKMAAITSGYSFVVLDPPAGGKNGYLSGAVLVTTSDPEQFKKLELEALNSMAMQKASNPDIVPKFTSTPNAATIKDVKLTRVNLKFSLREETPDKPINPAMRMMFPALQKMFGADGINVYMGTVGGRVLVVMGSDQTTLESAVSAAQDNTEDLVNNPAIGQMREQLVPNAIGVAYLPITRWITLANSIFKPGSETDPISPAIANAPPATLSTGINGTMMTAEIHVPIATVSGIQEAYQRFQRSMMGGPPAQQLP